ncbi:NAD(+)/NADH kinase [Candidatus Pacearchaeota archaeon]|nr:NAD(+)/NADH kinase [Candidatus Pacearchaeota archaeon]
MINEKKIKAIVVCKYPKNSKEAGVCRLIYHPGFEFKYAWKNTLIKKDLKNIDIVISVGGDGTALSAAHYLFDGPILIVNSSPKKSVGALSTINIDEIDEKLNQIKKGNYKIEKLERIKIYLNNKILEPMALNEVFIANEKAYLISKYKLKIKTKIKIKEEKQFSSGLIFSTGTGSTAWFKSAGRKPFSPQSRFIKMFVREPYFGKLHGFSILNHAMKENESVEVIPLTNSVLAIDSNREFNLKVGDKVRIKISRHPLLRIR